MGRMIRKRIGFCRVFKSVLALAVCMATLGMAGIAEAASLYAVNGAGGASSSLYTLDSTTGAATLVGATGTNHVTGLAVDPITGVLYGVRSDFFGSGDTQLLTIDKTTGAATVVGTTGHQIPDITFRADGTLFGWSEAPGDALGFDDLVMIDLVSGAATKVGNSGLDTSNTGLGFDNSGVLWLKNGSLLHTVDPATGLGSGALIALTDSPQNTLAFDPNSDTPFTIRRISGTSLLQTFDTGTGVVTTVGDTGVAGLSALAFEPVVVPIPAAAWMAVPLFGGLGITRLIRRRRLAV